MDWLSPVVTHYWTADWKAGTGAEAHLAHITLTQCLQFFGWTIPGTFLNVTITQAGPGIVHLFFTSPVGKLYVMETVTPLMPMLQKATHTIWAEWKLPRFIGKIVLAGLVRQFERDIPIWNNKTFLKKPTIVKGDGAIGQFRRWYSQFYSESSFELAKKIQESSLSW
jgi:cholesterol 7-dehydrogenase